MTAPSNSGPRPVFMVVGENAFHTMDSQMFVAIKREMPLENYQRLNFSNHRTQLTFQDRNLFAATRLGE